jgi:hypothetical protein
MQLLLLLLVAALLPSPARGEGAPETPSDAAFHAARARRLAAYGACWGAPRGAPARLPG